MNITTPFSKFGLVPLFLLALPLIIFSAFNLEMISLKFSLILGIIAFPFVVRLNTDSGGYRFAIAAVLTLSALLLVRSNALYYFSTAFILLFIIEKYWGRLNNLPILLVAVISPLVSTIVYIWSFPIRLKITDWAVQALQFIGTEITANGNVLILNGYSFSVDPACMGLKMIVSSMVISIIILAYFEKKQTHPISFLKTCSLLGLVLFLAVFANFIRLITLVIFYILPENPLHDIVGLLSMIVYVLVPFYFFAKFHFRNGVSYLDPIKVTKTAALPHTKIGITVLSFLLGFQIFTGVQFLSTPIDDASSFQEFEKNGYQKNITDRGVLKLQNESALIYIKAPARFYQGSHDPRFCWQGNGYDFSAVKIEAIGNKKVYTATLKKENDQIFTAWWYQNSTSTTPNEWDWRWNTMRGEDGFYLVNVNCETREELERVVIGY